VALSRRRLMALACLLAYRFMGTGASRTRLVFLLDSKETMSHLRRSDERFDAFTREVL